MSSATTRPCSGARGNPESRYPPAAIRASSPPRLSGWGTLGFESLGQSPQPRRLQQPLGARIEAFAALLDLLRDLLAQFDPELVERIDPHQHAVGEGAVLVEGDQRAEGGGVEVVGEDRRRGPVAGVGAR